MKFLALLIVSIPIVGYFYLWYKALRKDAEFRAARPNFELMLAENGWEKIQFKKLSLIEANKLTRTRIWFIGKTSIFRLDNDFIFVRRNGFDIYFKNKNPFESLIWENQKQINAITENEKEIELHYSLTFAKIERLVIGKVDRRDA